MTFQWLNKQGVESSEGFVVQRMDRISYHYEEGGKTLKVLVDDGLTPDGKYYVTLYFPEKLRWEAPFDKLVISPSEAARIEANFEAAMRFKECAMEIRRR